MVSYRGAAWAWSSSFSWIARITTWAIVAVHTRFASGSRRPWVTLGMTKLWVTFLQENPRHAPWSAETMTHLYTCFILWGALTVLSGKITALKCMQSVWQVNLAWVLLLLWRYLLHSKVSQTLISPFTGRLCWMTLKRLLAKLGHTRKWGFSYGHTFHSRALCMKKQVYLESILDSISSLLICLRALLFMWNALVWELLHKIEE
jgi:hypothetical protein